MVYGMGNSRKYLYSTTPLWMSKYIHYYQKQFISFLPLPTAEICSIGGVQIFFQTTLHIKMAGLYKLYKHFMWPSTRSNYEE
jgi:hypothetical protein